MIRGWLARERAAFARLRLWFWIALGLAVIGTSSGAFCRSVRAVQGTEIVYDENGLGGPR